MLRLRDSIRPTWSTIYKKLCYSFLHPLKKSHRTPLNKIEMKKQTSNKSIRNNNREPESKHFILIFHAFNLLLQKSIRILHRVRTVLTV